MGSPFSVAISVTRFCLGTGRRAVSGNVLRVRHAGRRVRGGLRHAGVKACGGKAHWLRYSTSRRSGWGCARAPGTAGRWGKSQRAASGRRGLVHVTCQTLPMPAIRLPHAGTPFWPWPAKGHSSRKAESGSSSSAMRSRAVGRRVGLGQQCRLLLRLHLTVLIARRTHREIGLDPGVGVYAAPRPVPWRPYTWPRIAPSAASMPCDWPGTALLAGWPSIRGGGMRCWPPFFSRANR